MTSYVDALAGLLDTLLTKGSIPKSSLSEKQRTALEPLFTGQILKTEPRGRGQSVTVQSSEGLEKFVEQRYPSGLKGEGSNTNLSRKSAIETRRDSKLSGIALDKLHVFRVFVRERLVHTAGDVEPLRSTRRAGLYSIRGEQLHQWELNGTLGTVENWELFNHMETLDTFEDVEVPPTFLYTGGNLSNDVFEWLGNRKNLEGVVHFGDYDPVGLREYNRLKVKLNTPVRFHRPPNLPQLFETYSKKSLLAREGSRKIFERVRATLSDDPEVSKIIELIEKHNAGLEQEILAEGY